MNERTAAWTATVMVVLAIGCRGATPPADVPGDEVGECGDGAVDPGEQCDDGNAVDDDGCTTLCALPACGDGIVQASAGERCDDGNADEDDGCTTLCALPACGDGVVSASGNEECDDGNAIDGDGCDSTCVRSLECEATATASTWSQRFGNGADQWGDTRVAAGPCGDIVLAGSLRSAIDFGGGPLQTAGSSDVFIARFDSDGENQWARRFGGGGFESVKAVAVSRYDAIAITGSLGDTDFGGGAPGGEVAVAVFDGDGELLWSRVGIGARGTAVAFDGAGNVYLAGTCTYETDLGGGLLPCVNNTELFLAKFDRAGNHVWSRAYLGPSGGEDGSGRGVLSMAIAASGDVFLAGSFDLLDLGGGPRGAFGFRAAFVARLENDGDHVWTRVISQSETSAANGLALTPSGGVVVAGETRTAGDFFGAGPVTAAGSDVYVAAFDGAGGLLWSRQFRDVSGTGDQSARGLALSPDGDVFVTGWHSGTIDFGGGPLTGSQGWDIFLVALEDGGDHIYSQVIGAPEFQHGFGVAADAAGNLIATGMFRNTIDFGHGPLASAGAYDIYLVKLTP